MSALKGSLLILLCLPYGGLTQPSPDFEVRFDQKAYVQISYRNNPSKRPIEVGTINFLPAFGEVKRNDTLTSKPGEQIYSLEVRTPQTGYCQIGRTRYDLYLLPADTVKLTIDFHADSVWHDSYLTYSGSTAIYQDFYRQHNLSLGNIGYTRALAANSASTLLAYQTTMDSLQRVEQAFFMAYLKSHTLPNWYVEDLTAQLLYGDAALRENAVFYRRFMNKGAEEAIPKNYFAFHKTAPISNPKAIHQLAYWEYLDSYFFLQSGRKMGQPADPGSLAKDFARADSLLTPALATYYKAFHLSLWARNAPEDALKLIDKYAADLRNPALTEVLRTDAKGRIKTLKPGDLAPTFALTDLRDSLVSSKTFRGNVVLLCFWFPGCKPCIAEFPYENELVKQFANQPVRIVSIGTINGRTAWLSAIKRHKLNTVHLYANENWQKTLEKKYAITGYPHYVLIDKTGRVVQNFAPRPSQNIAQIIEAQLKK